MRKPNKQMENYNFSLARKVESHCNRSDEQRMKHGCLQIVGLAAVTMLLNGCAMLIVQPGKYACTLKESETQETIRRRIGAPIFSTCSSPKTTNVLFCTMGYYDNEYEFDVFLVHGKIYEPYSDRVVGYGMASGVSFMLAEIILTPYATGQVLHELFTDRYLKVWYNNEFCYHQHQTIEIPKELKKASEHSIQMSE